MSARGQELWRWPLWSWKHLAMTCGLLAVVLIGLGRLQASGEQSGTSRPTPTPPDNVASSPKETASVAAPTASVAHAPSDSALPSSSPSKGDPADVARTFVTAWARPYDPASQWRARLTSMATPQLVAQLSRTDPLRIPATAVVGDGVEVSRSTVAVTIRHTTDNGRVLITLVRSGSRWLVEAIAPDESAGGVP